MPAFARDAPALEEVTGDRPQIGGNHPLDEAVIAALPEHLTATSADCYGTSAWSATACIKAEASDGKVTQFFIKYASGEHGRSQLEGEQRGMEEIHKTMPNLAPKPYGFGQLRSAPTPTYFFLCEFVNISDELPDPKLLGVRLAELHRKSQSPTGKFGFYCPTYDGKLPQTTEWDSSWASFFAKLIQGIAKLDAGVNGPWDELQEALDRTCEKVIPRLLGALQENGRKLKPCLIHGDLWEGNIGTDLETGELYIFDAASYYGHNEMELGIWRTDHHRMNGPAFKKEYESNFRASEPVEEWDDRNRLYCVKTQLMYSAHVPGTKVRQAALDNLQYLLNKYGRTSDTAQAQDTLTNTQSAKSSTDTNNNLASVDSYSSHDVETSQPVVTTIEV